MASSDTGQTPSSQDEEKFVPDILSEIDRREFDVTLAQAGFTPAMKRMILRNPVCATAMYNAAVIALGLTIPEDTNGSQELADKAESVA